MYEANLIEKGRTEDDRDDRMKHFSTYQNYILQNLPPNFQAYIERIKHAGIEEAGFVDVLCHPHLISDRPEVYRRPRRSWSDYKHRVIYKIKKPFVRMSELIYNFRHDLIEIKYSRGCTLRSKDWLKASLKKPKHKAEAKENK